MEASLNTQAPPTLTRDDLFAPFREAFKPRGQWKVGTEFEKFGVTTETFAPVQYDGPAGIRAVLEALVRRHGWRPEREHDGGPVIALTRRGASITLEPGGQLELSGAPFANLEDVASELADHLAELANVSTPLGLCWLGTGFHPLATQAQLPWIPKLRYSVMREYLPTRGRMGLDMMRRTCTVQANFDYADEQDALRKLRVSLALSPIVTAIFANSPLVEGRPTAEQSHRALVWLNTDPDRTGLLPFAWRDDASLASYVDWALDVPMFLIKRGGTIHRNTGQTFRAFMSDGYGGLRATRQDWIAHLATLFPEVRLKGTLEVRGTDAQRTPARVVAIAALWKGLLYAPQGLAPAERVAEGITYREAHRAQRDIARAGLRAELAGRPVRRWAEEVLDTARAGLPEEEQAYLDPVYRLLERGETPADELLQALGDATPTPAAIVAATELTVV